MTELELLQTIVDQGEHLIFLGQAQNIGLAWIGAALMVGGWLYARRDRDF